MDKYFKLEKRDFTKGLITAIFSALLVAIAGVSQQPGFSFFSADWINILKMALNASVITFVSYISKNALTNQENGKVLGKI